MQPTTDRPAGGGGNRQLRRYGPLVAILAVLAIVAGGLVFAGAAASAWLRTRRVGRSGGPA